MIYIVVVACLTLPGFDLVKGEWESPPGFLHLRFPFDHGDRTKLAVLRDEMLISTEPECAVIFIPPAAGSLNDRRARSLNCLSSSLLNKFIGMGTQKRSFHSTLLGS